MKSRGHSVEIIGADSPPERPQRVRRTVRDPTPERALAGLGMVDHGHQLEVGSTERHDPIGRAPTWMTPALDRGQAVPALENGGGCRQVTDRDEHMIELHTRSLAS